MKKILPIICLLILFNLTVKAQYVTIPDAGFTNWLQVHYPSAMIGNQMDTTDLSIKTTYTVNFAYYNGYIKNLSGIEYFSSLQNLLCNNDSLAAIPKLPNKLKNLSCIGNQLTSLPALPDSLTVLNCYSNQLTSLPVLPNTLTQLGCYKNQLTNLPNLPNTLTGLDCRFNQITSLPLLPSMVYYLYCDYNQLSILPTLPNVLKYLGFSYNQLSNLPTLPDSIQELFCNNNLLTSLPTLPDSLKYLNCSYNQLTSLPNLPNLFALECSNNLITCFPTFPNSIGSNMVGGVVYPPIFEILNNPFTCLPNYITAMDSTTLTYPLCSANNTNGCATAGIKQVTNNYYIRVYPNPVNSNFVIETNSSEEQTLQIIDLSGKTILNQNLHDKANIDANRIDNGMYFVQVKTNKNISVQKVIVQH